MGGRGGSKKGEHRGNARPGRVQVKYPSDPQRKIPGIAQVPNKQTEDYMREVIRAVQGTSARGRKLPPRDCMLEVQHYFWDEVENLKEHKARLEAMLNTPAFDTAEKIFGLDLQIESVRHQITEAMLRANEAARDAAPYYHAKLRSIEHTGPQGGPIEILGVLLDDIDAASRGRPSWQKPPLKLVESK
jgi:hypothetical protein